MSIYKVRIHQRAHTDIDVVAESRDEAVKKAHERVVNADPDTFIDEDRFENTYQVINDDE